MKGSWCLFASLLSLVPAWVQASETRTSGTAKICTQGPTIDLASEMGAAPPAPLDVCALTMLSPASLRLLRNSIFARHGYVFQSQDLAAYFGKLPWYRPDERFDLKQLGDAERDYVTTIRIVEEELGRKAVTNSDDTSSDDASDDPIGRPGFAKASDFLLPITDLPQAHGVKAHQDTLEFAEGKSIDLEQMKKGYTVQPNTIFSGPLWRTNDHGLLVMLTFQEPGVDGTPCYFYFYSFQGDPILKQHPGCPTHFLKQNPDILVEAEYSGCCGSDEWHFQLFDSARHKMVLDTYGNGDQSILSYLPDSKAIVFGTSYVHFAFEDTTLTFFDTDGNKLTTFYVAYIKDPITNEIINQFAIGSLVAVRALPTTDGWLLHFDGGKGPHFAWLARTPRFGPALGILKVDCYPGTQTNESAEIYLDGAYLSHTPYFGFVAAGKHHLRIVQAGMLDYLKDIDIEEAQPFATPGSLDARP